MSYKAIMIVVIPEIIIGCLGVGTGFCDTVRVKVKLEAPAQEEYYQKKDGNIERVREYPNTTVKDGFRYEEGKGIIKYQKIEPKAQDPDKRRTK